MCTEDCEFPSKPRFNQSPHVFIFCEIVLKHDMCARKCPVLNIQVDELSQSKHTCNQLITTLVTQIKRQLLVQSLSLLILPVSLKFMPDHSDTWITYRFVSLFCFSVVWSRILAFLDFFFLLIEHSTFFVKIVEVLVVVIHRGFHLLSLSVNLAEGGLFSVCIYS